MKKEVSPTNANGCFRVIMIAVLKRIALIGMAFFMILFTACAAHNEDQMPKEPQFTAYVIGETKALDELLTTEYRLAELRSFFENHHSNAASLDPEYSSLSLADVDSCFPVEVFRSNGYTVYKVEEGGYYYVFWAMAFPYNGADTDYSGGVPTVYFSAYCPSHSAVDFSSIEAGVSKASDVLLLDPDMQLDLLSSRGRFSYSYINENSILQIEYQIANTLEQYSDLIVEEMTIIPRESAASAFSRITEADLP